MVPLSSSAVVIADIREEAVSSQDKSRYFDAGDKKVSEDNAENRPPPAVRIVWRNVVLYSYVHLAALYGGYLTFTSATWQTNLFAFVLLQLSGLGVTAGVHRLWSHRTYKAKLPLRVFLAFCFTMSFQNDIYVWSRNHRVHHKYSETDADPHNAKRGFFFSHIGWILCRKHPEVIDKGRKIDLSDLLADPVVRFQRKYYNLLVLLVCFIIPTLMPVYFWNESLANSFFVAAVWRFVLALHLTFLVNSAAHMWGQRPYDASIGPAENWLVALGAVGEGFHNYHHTFPHDYATSEYGIKYNQTTMFIDFMAWVGLAYDRKSVPQEVVEAKKLKTKSE